jgi:VWFA-related protein
MVCLFRPLLAALFLCWSFSPGWSQTDKSQTSTGANQPEMVTRETPATFKTRVNLVMVPVVVRDAKGRATGTLHQEDFQLFDKGKPQVITRFSLEKPGSKTVNEAAAAVPPITTEGQPRPGDIPERFVAYLFDDRHLALGELARVRDAAMRHLATLRTTDRAAIYTTSGHNQLEFTDDRDRLQEAMLRIRPESISDPGGIEQCPEMTYYLADRIVNRSDTAAAGYAMQEVQACMYPIQGAAAKNIVQGAAFRMISLGREETRASLTALKDIVRRLSGMPGERTIMLISPGFITPEDHQEKSDVIDRAIHAKVMINTLDARGLWVGSIADASKPETFDPDFLRLKVEYEHEVANAQTDVLAEVAVGTGGSFFQNNNDFDEAFRRLAAAPEYYYLLGFSPQNLKLDGSFHALKVTLKTPAGTAIQARRGYYAPRKLSDAAETAHEEIVEAMFSREEMSDLPAELHTQFFKTSDKDATLTVRCRLDANGIPFRKVDGRNSDTVTVVFGIFDRNGNFLSGKEKVMELRLKDESVTRLMTAGMSVSTTFSIAPGTYMVRVVARDSEGQLMSAANAAVVIP